MPDLKEETYRLNVSGLGVRPMELTLQNIKTKFPRYTIFATLQVLSLPPPRPPPTPHSPP